jgi:hypothetical protein
VTLGILGTLEIKETNGKVREIVKKDALDLETAREQIQEIAPEKNQKQNDTDPIVVKGQEGQVKQKAIQNLKRQFFRLILVMDLI